MAFVKGQSGNPLGKPVGTISKDKAKFLQSLDELFTKYSGDMLEWLEQIEDPEKRFAILKDFAEFLYPKLSRSDNTTKINGEITLTGVTVGYKPPNNSTN